MKYTIAFLLLGVPSILWADPIHRCVDHQGQLSFQSNPCPDIETKLASLDPGARQAPLDRRTEARAEVHAEGRRMQTLLKEDNAEKDRLDKNNQNRCLSALRAARMCGRFAGMFSCGKRGFQHEEPSAKNSVELLRAIRGGREFTMRQCVQQVSE